MTTVNEVITPLGMILYRRGIHPRWIIAGSMTVAIGGVALAALMTDFYAFNAMYGVLWGGGMGVAYSMPLVLVWEYYPNHKGLLSGIMFASYGVSL